MTFPSAGVSEKVTKVLVGETAPDSKPQRVASHLEGLLLELTNMIMATVCEFLHRVELRTKASRPLY